MSLDIATFKLLDTATQPASWSSHDGTDVIYQNGEQAILEVNGSFGELFNNGLIDALGSRSQAIEGNSEVNLLSILDLTINVAETDEDLDNDIIKIF